MLLAPLLAPVVGFLIREVVVKFIVFTSLFALVAFLVPKAIGFLSPFLGLSSLSSAFTGLPAGVWFFLDFFNLGFGVPLLISAYVARFLIRRLPVIG
jgi:hypothetical protein